MNLRLANLSLPDHGCRYGTVWQVVEQTLFRRLRYDPKMASWQILDVRSIWMKEFASALAELEPVTAWSPVMQYTGAFRRWERSEALTDPMLTLHHFPLQRGYAAMPLRLLMPYEGRLLERLQRRVEDPGRSPLICTTPFYAPLAERWPGPVLYYVTDLTFAYEGLDPARVQCLDQRMCARAGAVLPNSRRIADYLTREAHCDPAKITVLPNATRLSNIAAEPQHHPGPLPEDIANLRRPIAGVLGDLSGNMDWLLLEATLAHTPEFTWVFVGPTTRAIADPLQRAARDRVRALPNACFAGMKAYGKLQQYARALDVAVLPYRRKEPTYSGSSTRFYEHLAAGRPMVATRGFAELLEKEPLLKLVDTAAEMTEALQSMAGFHFRDGQEEARWLASKSGTWQERARVLRDSVSL